MCNKNRTLMISTLIGVTLWIVYIFENEMATYGIYTLVDYGTHEILSMVPFVCMITTSVFLLILVRDMVRNKQIKSNMVISILLSVVLFLQVQFLVEKLNTVSVITVAQVVSIDSQRKEITIANDDLGNVVLTCPMIIFELLEVDKEYLITYEKNNQSSSQGNVNLIQIFEE